MGIVILFQFAACKQFLADLEEDLSYWTSVTSISGAILPQTAVPDKDGFPSISSQSDQQITIQLVNPKEYTLFLPGQTGCPADVITFDSHVQSIGGGAPQAGTDYTITQTDPMTLKLVYKQAFLEKNEYGGANIAPSFKLYNTDGRLFPQTYRFKLKVNTPPPALEYKATGKVQDKANSKWYYVLCFQAPAAEMSKSVSAGLLHKDMSRFVISEQGGGRQEIPLTVNSGATDFDISGSPQLLPVGSVDPITANDVPSGFSIASLPTGAWIICYKTAVEVKVGGTKHYTVQLRDEKGLASTETRQSTPENTVEDVTLILDTTTGTATAADLGAVNTGSTRYEIKNKPSASSITLNASTATAGATVKYKLNGGSEQSGTDIHLTVPATGSTDYTLEIWAEKPGLNASAHKTIYYRVIKTVYHTVTFLVRDGKGGKLRGTYKGNNKDSINTTKDFTVSHGETVTFTAMPDPGWEVESWGNAVATPANSTTAMLSNVTGQKTVWVIFKQIPININGTDPNAWKKLKDAVAAAPAGGIITIDGEIKATTITSNYGEITINKKITIKSKSGGSAVLNANKDGLGGFAHRIFTVNTGGELILDGITLKNGKVRGSGDAGNGGAILCKQGIVTLINSTIENCEAQVNDGAVCFHSGTFTLKGSSTIMIPAGADAYKAGRNDVYLHNNTAITVDGSLTPQDGIAARITHIVPVINKIVLKGKNGVDLANEKDKFTVTPQDLGGLSKQNWEIDSQGKLQKTDFLAVRYSDLDSYLGTIASSSNVNYIKVVGVNENQLMGEVNPPSPSPSPLGQLVKKHASKKIALELPDKVDGIQYMSGCFQDCTNLVSVKNIPQGVKFLQKCFKGCTGLTSAPELPSSLTYLHGTFEDCTALTTAPVIPSEVFEMSNCFKGCSALTAAPIIPQKVTKMSYCFSGCDHLMSATLNCNYSSSFSEAFQGCTSLPNGGIKVPSTQLSTYQSHAVGMGTTAVKFASQ